MTVPETANDTVTLTLPRTAFETLVQGFAAHITKSSRAATETSLWLTREIESGQPLSEELVDALIGNALGEDKNGVATLLAKAFRPSGELSAGENRLFKCNEFVRRGRATREAYNARFRYSNSR
ncbi:MAG: hypothetical protein RLZZ26_343 [Candidatus Parcubacteria bacterium]|jgi:hypothetical protein